MSEPPQPWLPGEAGTGFKRTGLTGTGLTGDNAAKAASTKRHAPATERNSDAIAQVLMMVLPPAGLVLEVASGSGEHAVHFARHFPHLRWLPSDPDAAALSSITAWADEAQLPNLAPPLHLDAAEPEAWPVGEVDALLCVNMIHISPWAATLGLMRGGARLLSPGAPLYIYGPYFREGFETAPSNLRFDESLRMRDPLWGLRWVHDVEAAALAEGLALDRIVEMPANNLSLIFRRGPHPG